MKKNVCLLLVLVCIMSACKKEYTCVCTTEDLVTGTITTDSKTIEARQREDAYGECVVGDGFTKNMNAVQADKVVSCTLR